MSINKGQAIASCGGLFTTSYGFTALSEAPHIKTVEGEDKKFGTF
jgi:hypothetical protein